ncbi:MAG: M48 family metallopeptidase [Aquabacterium sp.]
MTEIGSRLSVDYFDGHTARAHRVQMWMENGMLQLAGRDLIRQVPLSKVQWPERTRHGFRLAHIADGGSIQALDASDWDTWTRQHKLGEPLVVKAQQSWRWTVVATCLLLTVTVLGYWWGLPLAARAIAPLIPLSVDKQVGRTTLQAMDDQWLKPSKLQAADQAHWRARFDLAAQRDAQAHDGATPGLPIQWYFRQAPIGPNAFALPDGSVIVTDELIDLLHDREDVLLGVLGHELGHVALRHGMRTLIQTGLLSAATSVALGDFSSVLAGAPVLLGHMAYSRDLEREADESAIRFMRHNDIRPSAMIVLFQRLEAWRRQEQARRPSGQGTSSTPGLMGIAFSSHPPDAERIARFKAADQGLQSDPSSP